MSSLSSILLNIKNGIPTLTNPSATAIFQKLASAFSITIDNTIDELANTQNIIDSNIAANNYGKAGYYVNAALAYEDGVNMVIDPVTLNYIYSPIDVTKQTISQAAFEEATLTLKVSALDNTGNLAKLSGAILTRFKAYFKQTGSGGPSLYGGFEIPGIPINIISLDPNVFTANFTFTYYGSYSLTNIQSALISAMNTFIQGFQYNGVLYVGDLADYLKQNVAGIRDVVIGNPTIDSVIFTGSTSLSAGYFTADSSSLINTAVYNSI